MTNFTDSEENDQISENSYYPQATSPEIGLLTAVTEIDNARPEILFEGKSITISCRNSETLRLSLSAKKLFTYLMLLLTKYNGNETDWTNRELRFTLSDYMKAIGIEDNRQNRNQYYDELLTDVRSLYAVYMQSDRLDINGLLTGHAITGIEGEKSAKVAVVNGKGYFCTFVNPVLLKLLSNRGRIQSICIELLSAVGKNANSFGMIHKMLSHYAQNRGKPNQNRLRVSTLLACCPEINTARYDKRRERFETALNALVNSNTASDGTCPASIIRWSYEYKEKLISCADMGRYRLKDRVWRDLIVQFELHGWTDKRYADNRHLDTAYRFDNQKTIDYYREEYDECEDENQTTTE